MTLLMQQVICAYFRLLLISISVLQTTQHITNYAKNAC